MTDSAQRDESVERRSIEEKLRDTWREEMRFVHLRGASRLVVWAVVLLGVDFLIDWGIFFRGGMTMRIGMLLAATNVVILGWVLWRDWLRHLRRFNPLRVALEVEEKNPELSSLLVSYTQLQGPVVDQPKVSVELIEAMRGEARGRARPVDFRKIVDFEQLTGLLAVAATLLLVFGFLGLGWQDHVSTLFQRLAGASVSYPRQTRIVDVSDDLIVRIGDSATITAEAAGVIPEEGRLFTRPDEDGSAWQALPMVRARDVPVFRRELKELSRDLLFAVELGDNRSEARRIRVVPSPRVSESRVRLVYPSYMNRDPDETDRLDLEVPEGTELEWTLRCEPAVKRLQIRWGEETVDADIDASGTRLGFTLRADEAFRYAFRWTEAGSGKDFEYDDVQHTVRVIADRVPEVELLEPTVDGLVTVKKRLKIRFRASDDHGLTSAWLVTSIDGGEETRVDVHDFQSARSEEVTHVWSPAESYPGLRPGARLAFAIVVADAHSDREAHTRRSATRQLTVVEPERYLQWFREELAAQYDDLQRTRALEKESSARVKELRRQEGGER